MDGEHNGDHTRLLKTTQRALQERDAILRVAASEAPMLLQTRDRDSRLTFITGGLMHELEVDADRAIGTKFEMLPGTDDPNHPIVGAQTTALGGKPSPVIRFELQRHLIEARVEPLHDEDGSIRGTVCVWFDVTETRRAEQVARERYDQIELAATHTPSVLWAVKRDGTLTMLTGGALSTLGWNPADMVGRPLDEALAIAGDRDPNRVTRLMSPLSGKPVEYETTWGDRVFMIHAKPVRDLDGSITGVIGIAYDVTEQKEAHERTRFLTNYDALTGLPNRAKLVDLLSEHLTTVGDGGHVAVLAVDLEGFKRVNDTLGFDAGDSLLIEVAHRLRRVFQSDGTVSRSSGDEFLVVRAGLDSPTGASKVAAIVLASFDEPFTIAGRELFVRPSIGVSIYPEDGEEAEALLARADAALLQAKQHGRSSVQFFRESLQLSAMDRLSLEADLSRAVERDEFALCYQPIVNVADGKLMGAEALLRWQHPSRGLLRPDAFISVAEETGLIVRIGEWVLREACEQAARWNGENPDFFVSVNVSAAQLDRGTFETILHRALREKSCNPAQLELEFTERLLMRDAQRGIEAMRSMRNAGVRIAVDDFGTGYSSLAYLKQLPVDTMKIDRLFVRDIASVPYDAAIARAIIALAESINLRIVAEGVETVEQADLLEALGCSCMQGYYFSEPVPREEFEQFFGRSRFFPRGVSRIES